MEKIKDNYQNSQITYRNIQLEGHYLYVFDSPISCGMKLIEGIEDFFRSFGNPEEAKKTFVQLMKYINIQIPAAFYIISYRENMLYFKKGNIHEFLDQMFKPCITGVNPNSENHINVKIACRSGLFTILNKLEKELGSSSSN